MKMLTNANGMTLVESVVAGTLAIVIGFVMYTVTFAYTNESGSSISRFMIQQQYDNVASQIARDIRRASFVGADGETPLAFNAEFDTVNSINLFDASGQKFNQYTIVDGILREGLQQSSYSAGGQPVCFSDGNSSFILSPARRAVTMRLSIYRQERNKTHTLSNRRDVFICRN